MGIGTAECRRFGSAVGVANGVVRGGNTRNIGDGVLDHLAVLHIEAADFGKCAGGGAIRGDELGDDSELGGGVDGLLGAKERLVAEAVGVEIAAGFVAGAGCGAGLSIDGAADVGGVRGVEGVGFPDIHFVAAGAVVTVSGVGRGAVPVKDVGLQILKQ